MSVYDDIHVIKSPSDGFRYRLNKTLTYYSPRYNKRVTAYKGEKFDGATGAIDIDSRAWVMHDVLCNKGKFDDGTPCNNWQASMVLHDILKLEGRWFRRHTWFWATWLFGGGKARDNGML